MFREEIRDDEPILLLCVTIISAIFLFSLCAYGLYRLFSNYAESMEVYEVCLLEFKESPMSKKVVEHLPTMDVIKEEEDNDDEEQEMILSKKLSQIGDTSLTFKKGDLTNFMEQRKKMLSGTLVDEEKFKTGNYSLQKSTTSSN